MHSRWQVSLIAILLCSAGHAAVSSSDLFKAATEGTKLSPDQIPPMEGSLLSSPNNGAVRARLLGYYSLRKTADPRRRQLNILWFVENMPADPFAGSAYCQIDSKADAAGYDRVKTAWQQQRTKNANNTAMLTNAADFFLATDDAISEDILNHCADLEPKNGIWLEKLAALYERRALYIPTSRVKSSAQALTDRDKLFLMTPDARLRFAGFIEMPRDAFLNGDMVRAKQLGAQLLAMADNFHDDPNYGLAIHQGNIVLGRVSLNLDDLEGAGTYLIAAGKSPASARLASDGPDMGLARELLARGERKSVRDYLGLCGRLWPNGSARLKSWQASIDDGGTPDFGNQAIW